MNKGTEVSVNHVATYTTRIEVHRDGGIAMHPPHKLHHVLRQLAGYPVHVSLCVVTPSDDPVASIVRMAAATIELNERFAKIEEKQ